MKNVMRVGLYLLTLGLIISCTEEECWVEQEVYENVWIRQSDLPSLIRIEESQELNSIGKINYYNNHVFISEADKGVQIIDISEPANPIKRNFIAIPGLGDIGIQNNTLYASQYNDLVALNISNLDYPIEINRNANAFDEFYVNNDSIFVEVRATGETQLIPCYGRYIDCINCAQDEALYLNNASNGSSPVSTGLAGSLATFALTNHQVLYTLNDNAITTFDLKSSNMDEMSSNYVSWDVETLFPYRDKLFVGTRQGMIIMSIVSPFDPTLLSEYSHWTSCDPVVVDENYAYLTLRDGVACREGLNQLEIINIQNPQQPYVEGTVAMTNPRGLGLGSNHALFVCDGPDGLKVFDKEDTPQITLQGHFPDMLAQDVIALEEVLIMIAKEGLYLYDYNDPQNIQLLSTISL